MTVKKFEELIAKDKAKRESLNAEIKELLQKEAELDAAAKDAASAGDVVAYKTAIAAKADVETDLFVKRTCLDKLSGTATAEDAKAAWADYSADYSKKLKKALADFQAEREKLCGMYSALLDLQGAACGVRERLSSAVGIDVNAFSMESIPCLSGAEPGALTINGSAVKDPDAAYYLANYCRRNKTGLFSMSGVNPEVERINNVLVKRHS